METYVNIDDVDRINQEHLAEYLITNGLGGYASSTIINLNTRKYHGLLVAAPSHSKTRYVILSSIDERIEIDKTIYEIGSHNYKEDYNADKKDLFFPQGFKFLKKFEHKNGNFPKFYYEIEDVELQKEIIMPYGCNAVILHYKIKNENKRRLKFSLFPLLNMRYFHENLHLSDTKEFICENSDRAITVRYTKIDSIKAKLTSNIEFFEKECVLWNVFYKDEKERGYDCFEDLYCPGYFGATVNENESEKEIDVIATIGENIGNSVRWLNHEEIKENERLRLTNINTPFSTNDEIFQLLSTSADRFIVQHPDGAGIIAGYHWFDEWGRDTMISIPGLCLTTKRSDIAKGLIKRWLNFTKDGLIPNFIPVQYPFECPRNSSDASLWLFNTLYHYYQHTYDIKFIEEIYQKLCGIIECYIKGNTACKMDKDRLIISNPQTTWMDTKWTIREGKAVEINALWYNALSILKFFSNLLNKQFIYDEILKDVKANFEIFWDEEKGCLYDVVKNDDYDDSIRPNQIFAISLPFSIINDKGAEKIFNVVFEELYTPYGLRTLSRKDHKYRGVYEGNEEERDKAYHNGTVWPWLIGNFVDAYVKIYGNKGKESKQEAMKFLNPLREYVKKFNTIPEIFDGNFPHKPRGCIAQAWSVGEVMRVLI